MINSARNKDGIVKPGKSGSTNKIIENGKLSERRINTLNNENTSPNESRVKLSNMQYSLKDKFKLFNAPVNKNDSNKNVYKLSTMTNFHNKFEKKTTRSKTIMADLDKVKISHKSFGVIEAYSAITTEGLYRDYNEDRVSIIFNISKPLNYNDGKEGPWPKCSFFGIYDGHGGSGCADYLRDNLHKYIINDHNFPSNPQKAILNGFVKAEKNFLSKAVSRNSDNKISVIDRSGSCAIVLLIVEKRCFIANVGDSRAIMSGCSGAKTYCLSRDHRPNDEKEYKRVLEAGGKIYQTEIDNNITNIIGPLRVFPGKLSVSRTIGDIEAKEPSLGGNSNVVIGVPEIKYFDITSKNDFIIIGCDGIFEKMRNSDIVDHLWKLIDSDMMESVCDVHNLNGILVDSLVKECLKKKSTDNLTLVMISFKENFKYTTMNTDTGYAATAIQNKINKRINEEESNVKEQKNILSKIIKNSKLIGKK